MKRKSTPIQKARRRSLREQLQIRVAITDARRLPFNDQETATALCNAVEWFLALDATERLIKLHRAFAYDREIAPILKARRRFIGIDQAGNKVTGEPQA